MQQAGQVGGCPLKGGLVDESEPVNITTSVKRWPIYQRVKTAMVGVEGGSCSKTDSRVIECVQFGESALACGSIVRSPKSSVGRIVLLIS